MANSWTCNCRTLVDSPQDCRRKYPATTGASSPGVLQPPMSVQTVQVETEHPVDQALVGIRRDIDQQRTHSVFSARTISQMRCYARIKAGIGKTRVFSHSDFFRTESTVHHRCLTLCQARCRSVPFGSKAICASTYHGCAGITLGNRARRESQMSERST